MGLLSSRASITCYRVEGSLSRPVADTVYKHLKANTIANIDDQPAEKAVGWSSFENPLADDFSKATVQFGNYLAFCLRCDKKTIPPKVVKKYCEAENRKRLEKKDQNLLSKQEKRHLKDKVVHELALRIPATPKAHDVVWDYEAGRLWFFSTLKGANEELETLFLKSFSLRIIRLFPYTIAALETDLSDQEKDRLFTCSPASFME